MQNPQLIEEVRTKNQVWSDQRFYVACHFKWSVRINGSRDAGLGEIWLTGLVMADMQASRALLIYESSKNGVAYQNQIKRKKKGQLATLLSQFQSLILYMLPSIDHLCMIRVAFINNSSPTEHYNLTTGLIFSILYYVDSSIVLLERTAAFNCAEPRLTETSLPQIALLKLSHFHSATNS